MKRFCGELVDAGLTSHKIFNQIQYTNNWKGFPNHKPGVVFWGVRGRCVGGLAPGSRGGAKGPGLKLFNPQNMGQKSHSQGWIQ